MPGSDVEHVSCYLDGSAHHFPHPSSQLSDQCFDTPADGALNGALISPPPASFLATTTYSPSRPDLLDSQQGHPPPSSPLSEYPDNHNQIQHSLPNPDDYYRNHGVPLAGDSGVNPSDTSATGPSVDTNERLTLAGNATSLPTDTLESSRVRRPQYRSVSYSAYKGPENGPVRTPRLPYSDPRSRQPSFKDLVNKFNNNPDQILPLPSVPRSREASRAGSPAGSVDGQIRSRASSRLRETPDTSTQRQPTVPWDPTGSELPYFSTDLAPPPLCIADNPGKHVDNPEPLKPSRHQLFSELLPVDTGFHNSGVGIPGYLRRRGSDGSIPSPNPASLDHHGLSPGLSPLTPTAWYLGHTQLLDAVNSGGNTNNHRRTRSDLTGSQILPAFADPNHSMAIPGPLQMQPSGLLETPHSKSRIPISSRRLSPDSVSGSSSRSLGPNSTFSSRSATYGPVPVKGTSRLPIPSPKGSPDEINDSREPLAILSPGPGRTRRQTPEKNSLLTAYIAAPPPKKSPPLRSSRPRQPVTNATSSPPRSKVGQTVSNFQSQINRDRESRSSRPRQRRLPELGNVDFAIRRQRIQQAFNRTVQENERKEEEEAAELRHREQEQGGVADRAQDQEAQPSPEDPTIEIHSQAEDTATVIDESTQISDEEKESITENEGFRQLPQLHIDTSTSAHEASEANADHHLVTMDSPTLGLSEMAPRDQDIVRSDSKADNMPPSAATPGSTDTHVTAFDQEPQTGLTRRTLNMSHRTLLNQIMQIRESSSSSSSCDEPEYSFSDNDDAESIPIMLRDTSYSESHRGSESNRGDRNLSNQRAQAGNEVENRWSMSSWSFSLRNQPSAYEQCEASGDEISYRPASPDSDPTTQSCSGTSSTPPSVSGFHQSAEPTHHGSQVLEQRNEQTAQRNACMPSNAPSLARQGGWDSKRVAQLYLEELARGRGHHFQLPTVRAGPEPQPSDSDWKSDRRPDSLTDDPVLVPRFDDALSSDRLGHAASLVFRDDWEHASPSIADWMQVAAEDEAALPEDKSGAISIREGSPTPRVVTSRMQQEGLETRDTRLGLAINVELPQGLDSEDTPPPPLPRRSPPPPPEDEETSHPPQAPLDPPASHSSSSAGLAQLGPINSAGSSENSSLQRLEPIPSPQLVDSSATSLVPSNPEHASIEFQKKSPSPEQRRLKKRLHVIKELIDTEYTFGRDMKVVDDIYKGTSSSCLDLSAEDVKVLFANSDQIVQFSTMFQDALKDAARSVYVMPKSQRWSSKRTSRNHNSSDSKEDQLWAGTTEASELEKDQLTFIGEAFMTHISRMEKVYTDYLKNHDAANKKLQSLQRNPKVAIWLKECRDWAADLTTAWDLDSLLVKPVQRIVKYPLLLDQLLSSTPSDHPDGELIAKALEEVTNISVRINEMKKRADLVGQVVGRKRKESDVRAGLSKAFGRRTEKLKQHVGLSDMFEDKGYDTLSQRFGDSYFQLQVVMRDVEMYAQTTQASMDHLNDFVGAIEGMLDVSQSIYSELEGKWRELRIALHEVMTIALPDHLAIVRRSVINPMITLLKYYDGPQRVMRKRDKRLMDYARFKAGKQRGDRPDKKTTEQGEQFMALNETLKDELPRLYSLTAKLMGACLNNFVQIQTTWFNSLEKRFSHLTDSFPEDIQKIVNEWTGAFTMVEPQVYSLGICNGSLLADAVNSMNYNNTPSTGANISSPRRPSTVNSASTRVESVMDESPKVSYDFGGSSHSFQSPTTDNQSQMSNGRHRADSVMSGPSASETYEIQRSQLLQRITNAQPGPAPPYTANPTAFPGLSEVNLDASLLADVFERPMSDNPPASPAGRYSGFFSSALPMSDTPEEITPVDNGPPKEPKVLFLAASVYEFNIDRARREAGYPYLTYVAGEIFDVIAEKGELWLARNQDDSTNQVGWIWSKHFAKLSA